MRRARSMTSVTDAAATTIRVRLMIDPAALPIVMSRSWWPSTVGALGDGSSAQRWIAAEKETRGRMRRTAPRAASSMTLKRTHTVAVAVASVHLLGVLLTALYVSRSSEGQAPLVW